MLIGYNTNIKYRGKTYHVQTEDSGLTNPQIVTLLYHQGAILASKKTNYAHLLGESDFEDKLRNLMKRQHREMIIELKRIVGEEGTVDPGEVDQKTPELTNLCSSESRPSGEGSSDPVGGIASKKGLDDILIDFITKRGRK